MDEFQLVGASQRGDKAAFGLLTDRYYKNIYRLAYQHTGSYHDADDVCQEAFLRAYKSIGKLKDRNCFKSWVFAIALNLLRERIKETKREEQVTAERSYSAGAEAVEHVDAPPLETLSTREKAMLVQERLREMPEHGWWGGKHNNYEGATRAPLIIAVPGQKNQGAKSDALVEFVDVYPSLVDICGLPMPTGLEGQSFKPLLDDPLGSVKKAGHSWYPKGGYRGIAMRTDRWRFVEWRKAGSPEVYELYDHKNDPEENENLANKPEHDATIKELSAMLHANLKAEL